MIISFKRIRELKTMDIAVLGYGVVGSGVAEVISLNEQKITKKSAEKK